MRTEISVPDALLSAVAAKAADLHMSTSEFFSAAARRYLIELEEDELEHAIDAAVADLTESGALLIDARWTTRYAAQVLGDPW